MRGADVSGRGLDAGDERRDGLDHGHYVSGRYGLADEQKLMYMTIGMRFPIVLLLGSRFIPFSPRWLLQQGRRKEAWHVVRQLHKTPEDKDDMKAKEEFFLIEQQYKMDKEVSLGRRFELFRTPANRRRALVGALLMWGDQFLGIFVMTNYGTP